MWSCKERIGVLIYLGNTVRPDIITYSLITTLSRIMQDYGECIGEQRFRCQDILTRRENWATIISRMLKGIQ